MLRTARHMHDFASLEPDPPANAEQEIGVVSDRRFRLCLGFDLRVTEPMPESVARAVRRRRMLDVEMRMHHGAARPQQAE